MTIDDLLQIFGILLVTGYGIAAAAAVLRLAFDEVVDTLDDIRRGGN